MAGTNDFLPFCPTDTGSNLLTQVEYAADPQLAIGNQPGVARSKLVNKAVRQATYIAATLSQYLANLTGDNVLDDENQTNLLATMGKGLRKAPTVQKFTSASGTYTRPSNPSPLYIRVRMVGGGGGGGGSGATSGGTGGTGGNTTFGTTLLVANGGVGGAAASNSNDGGAGGSASLGTGPLGVAISGGRGSAAAFFNGSASLTDFVGASGAPTPFGGAGGATVTNSAGNDGVTNSGSGAAGGGANSGNSPTTPGGGGGAGGFVDAVITSPAASYAYAVGAGGAAGTAGTSGSAGGTGGSGVIIVEEFYQ